MWDAIPGTGEEQSLAQRVPASPAPTISTACPESSTPAAPNSTSTPLHRSSSTPSSPPAGHTSAWAPVLFPQPPAPGVTPSSSVPASTPPAFNPVSSKSPSHLQKPSSYCSQSDFPANPVPWASQMPIRSHLDSAVQFSPCTSQLSAGSHCQTPPLASSVSLTAPHTNHTSEPSSSDLSPSSSKPPPQPHYFSFSSLYSASLRFCTPAL